MLCTVSYAQWAPGNGGIYYNGGRVGIGTTTLNAKLSVFGEGGGGYSPTLELQSSNTEYAWSLVSLKSSTDNTTDYMLGRGGSSLNGGRMLTFHIPDRSLYGNSGVLPKIGFYSSGGNNLGFIEAETGNWYMKGSVGIGTTSPEARLAVDQGATNNLALSLTSSGPGWGSGLLLKNTAPGGNMYGIYSGADGMLHFANEGREADDLIIHPTGNIGIGTSSPDARLTVAGNVHAREVKVTVAAGADFVFEEDYALPSLQETENFVRANKHLPGIAPAVEMEQEGLDLGKMNILLLQKVEELTLYIIEQDKQMQQLKAEVQKLKDQ